MKFIILKLKHYGTDKTHANEVPPSACSNPSPKSLLLITSYPKNMEARLVNNNVGEFTILNVLSKNAYVIRV